MVMLSESNLLSLHLQACSITLSSDNRGAIAVCCVTTKNDFSVEAFYRYPSFSSLSPHHHPVMRIVSGRTFKLLLKPLGFKRKKKKPLLLGVFAETLPELRSP